MALKGKHVWAGLLMMVAVVSVVVVARHAMQSRTPTLPKAIASQSVSLVDKDTLEVVGMSMPEFQTAERKDGYIKNPKTGQFTLAAAFVCEACGKEIPQIRVGGGRGAASVNQLDPAWRKAQVCPRCKGCPYAKSLEQAQ